MTKILQTLGMVAVALLCGIGGYWYGKQNADFNSTTRSEIATSGDAKGVEKKPRNNSSEKLDTQKLRKSLDNESSALKRMKMAMENMEAWVAANPIEALDWLASQEPTDRRDEIMRIALQQFAETDGKGAAEWAMKNLKGIDLNNGLIFIAKTWAVQNGNEAAAWFLERPTSPERNAALEQILFTWGSNDPVAAVAYLTAHPNLGDFSAQMNRAALAGWAKSDPTGAAQKSLELSQKNKDPDQFANTMANWATHDLDGSAAWLANRPPGEERTAAGGQIALIFADQSPQDGIEWIEKLNDGVEQDTAAGAFVDEWSRKNPSKAANWMVKAKHINFSDETIAEVSHNYLMKDEKGFTAWRNSLVPGPFRDKVPEPTDPLSREDE